LIAGEKPAEQTYRYLEIFDVNIAIERQITDDKRSRSFSLGIETHQDECVECIDWRHEERLSVPIVSGFTQRSQRVLTPRITLVIAPSVQKFSSHTRKELPHGFVLA